MAKFLKVILSNPQGAQLLNLDGIMAVAQGEDGKAKLHMASGEIYLTACSHEDFVQILRSRGLLLLE